jgi:cytochrome c oxidase subunit 1
MAFPRLNMASFWTFALSLALVVCSFFGQLGAAGAGWTTYPPLSTNIGTPGSGQTFMVAAIFVTGVSTIMGGINTITTVIRFRAPGMGYFRMPLTVWGLWLTSTSSSCRCSARRRCCCSSTASPAPSSSSRAPRR